MALSHGMNVEEVEAAGSRLRDHYASELNRFAQEIEGIVAETSTTWVGPDADRFRSWWPEKRTTILGAADNLRGFGQSALNNAAEQRMASGASGPDTRPSSAQPATPHSAAGAPAGNGSEARSAGPPAAANGSGGRSVLPPQSWQEASAAYDEWAYGRFAPGGESHYQCTGWANFRWQQLGYEGEVRGHGGAMARNAPGSPSSVPSLHAIASAPSGAYGHVMIVEEVMGGGTQIRVSEMNVGSNPEVGEAHEYRDTKVYTQSPDGKFRRNGVVLEFAKFPG